jgi:hypothetical protein
LPDARKVTVVHTRQFVVLLVAGAGILSSAQLAAAAAAAPAIVAPSPIAAIKTCAPRVIVYDGIYRIDNDLFAGSPGDSCITAKGSGLTISNCSPGDGNDAAPQYVTRYPKVYIGQNYTSGDRLSGLPVRMTRTQNYTLDVKFGGTPSCKVNSYIDDLDMMFSSSLATADQHPTAELVIAGRWDHGDMTGGKRISIDHHWYYETPWTTHTPGTAGPYWPLIRLVPEDSFSSRTFHLATFMWHLRTMGLVKPDMVLDMAAAGTECWVGCRGLTDSMAPDLAAGAP